MGSSTGGVLRGFAHAARITTEGNKVPQQTNGHNHPVDGVEANETYPDEIYMQSNNKARYIFPQISWRKWRLHLKYVHLLH